MDVAAEIEKRCKIECRVLVLGHLQRGGTPTAFDRWLATRFGAAAFRLAIEGKFGGMVALRGGKIVDIPLSEALRVNKKVDLEGDPIRTARGLGLCLGDE
jgi:6-phosphofructokinase 1